MVISSRCVDMQGMVARVAIAGVFSPYARRFTATQNGELREGTPRKSARIAFCATGFTTGKML